MNLVIVRLIKKRQIYNFILPTEISGNYWITDTDYLGNQRNLINVEEYHGHWKIKSDFETKIMNGDEELKSAILEDYHFVFLKETVSTKLAYTTSFAIHDVICIFAACIS